MECGHICEMIRVIHREGIHHPDWQEEEIPHRRDNTPLLLTVHLGYSKLYGRDKWELTLEK